MKTILEISNHLVNDIEQLIEITQQYQTCQQNQMIYKTIQNTNDNNQLKIKETRFDQLYEYHNRIEMTKTIYKKMKHTIKLYFKSINEELLQIENNRETNIIQMNQLLEEMKEDEKEMKHKKFNQTFEMLNYSSFHVETINEKQQRKEMKRQIKQENELKIRIEYVKDILNENEVKQIEKECGRECDLILFDSNQHQWSKMNSQFHSLVMNQSNIIILMETIDGRKFGCFIQSLIHQIGSYIEDSHAFIFSLENQLFEKYSINEYSFAIKICHEKDDDLFIIGRNDIVIKKKEKKEKCSCKQVSFNYNDTNNGLKENILIGKKGVFQIKHICILPLKTSKERQYNLSLSPINQFNQLEQWTSLKCSEIVFDSMKHNWATETSVLNERIIGKSKLVFLIEDEDGEKFGYFEHTKIQNNIKSFVTTDEYSFHFNLQSQYGRLDSSMKFEIINKQRGGYRLYHNNQWDLIRIGDIKLFKENHKNDSVCDEDELGFSYHSLKSSLCGKSGFDHPMKPKRIVVIQMK